MKSLLIFLIFAGLIAGGYFYIIRPQIAVAPSLEGFKTYSNSQYGFKFQYPKDFIVTQPQITFLSTGIVRVEANADKYPQTNLGDYSISINTADYGSSCTWGVEAGPNSGSPLVKKINVNGALFYVDKATVTAAGNLYESRIYRTEHDSKCFEVVLTIHTATIGNRPTDKSEELNRTPIWTELEQVFSTFKFTR